MLRALVRLTLLLLVVPPASGQALGVLRIRVVLVDSERVATPVAHHALLISDNPATAAPRRVLTARDGTAEVRLRPGNYTVESDQPVAFQGKSYQWTQLVDVVAGRDVVLELTGTNAEVEPVASTRPGSAAPPDTDPSFLLGRWQDSVVALWTPESRASGFLVDAQGLVATTQRVIGAATSVEVQLTPAVKVAARVLSADPERDVAILWIDPKVASSVRAVSLECEQTARPLVENGQTVFTIGAPFRGEKRLTSGTVSRVEPHAFAADFLLAAGSAGGPVFAANGSVVGIASVAGENDQDRRGSSRVVRIGEACEAVALAGKKMKEGPPPDATHLPVEPARLYPEDVLADAVQQRAGRMSPYQLSSSDFDIALITPVLTYGAQHPPERASKPERGARTPDVEPPFVRPLMDFGTWSSYVADFPAVLLVRVTPKLVEGFWTKVARGAAQTQGVSLPPLKRFKSGFSRLRAFCGDREVLPIHPFKLLHPISETDAIYEGLYVFDPGALAPACSTVKLELYSEKEPQKPDTRVVDPKLLDQIWQDFGPYRALK
jgi:S1-C subfamily serine protease